MNKAALSVFIAGIIIFLLGVILIFFPVELLGLLRFEACDTNTIPRLLGLVTMVLGLNYLFAGFNNLTLFIKFTVAGRLIFFLGTVAFFLLGWAGSNIFLISSIDLVGATITAILLKNN